MSDTINIDIIQQCEEVVVNISECGGGIQSIVAGANVTVDDTDPLNPIVSASGGGGGAVDSVNGQIGVVVLDTGDISSVSNSRYVTDADLVILSNTSGTNSGNETATTIGALINAAAAATPNDTDLVATAENAGLLKKITWTNVKAFLKTYFDTLYQTILVSGTSIKTINSTSLLGAGDISITPNATHTGEVTGATTLTVDKTAITNKTTVTIDTADYVLISDSSDSGNLKKGLVSDLGGFDDGDFTLVASFKSLYNY